ncbi:MAG TPA: UdgX family uracil-DNA binding protein, partial [Pseudolabrys sp.]|nr:UdgX family uracil-DNA binding protein [Pseudolabrys sp.]
LRQEARVAETIVAIRSLKALRAAEAECTRCPLYRNATQVVSGEGPARARLMMVGEQPGDQEDRQGHPFVGPAGGMLAKALDDAGIDRDEVFVTNAVKHFKFEPRGKRRLHKRPNAYEIDQCHWWFEFERKLVKPELIVALGATAVRSVSGRPLAIGKIRGRVMPLEDGGRMLATIHPSAILRAPEEKDRHALFKQFVADLKVGARVLAAAA